MNGVIRDQLLAQQKHLAALLQNRDGISIERSPDHIDDLVATINRGLHAQTLNLYSARLADTRKALELLEEGTYGFCTDCEEEISPARLKAKLEAIRCKSCQEIFDTSNSNDEF